MSIRTWTWTALGIGIAVLLVPLFLPPDPIYPTAMSFSPYPILFAASLITRSKRHSAVLLWVTLITTLVGSFVYLDTLRFNLLLSWQISGLVTSFIPWFQLAVSLPVALWLLVRGRQGPDVADEPASQQKV